MLGPCIDQSSWREALVTGTRYSTVVVEERPDTATSSGTGKGGGKGKGKGKSFNHGGGNSYKWGPWTISRVHMHGKWIGMGATCNGHKNAWDGPGNVCQTHIYFETAKERVDENEATLRLQRWLVAGLDIKDGQRDSRTYYFTAVAMSRVVLLEWWLAFEHV